MNAAERQHLLALLSMAEDDMSNAVSVRQRARRASATAFRSHSGRDRFKAGRASSGAVLGTAARDAPPPRPRRACVCLSPKFDQHRTNLAPLGASHPSRLAFVYLTRQLAKDVSSLFEHFTPALRFIG
jgi:hypothetical protein